MKQVLFEGRVYTHYGEGEPCRESLKDLLLAEGLPAKMAKNLLAAFKATPPLPNPTSPLPER